MKFTWNKTYPTYILREPSCPSIGLHKYKGKKIDGPKLVLSSSRLF